MRTEATEKGRERRRSYDRNSRRRVVRATTVTARGMKRAIEAGRLENPVVEGVERPKRRLDCLPGGCNEVRPCPFVSCKWHLYVDVSKSGSIKMNFPDLEPDELTETCALDVADRGGETLEDLGALMNITRERVRQVENIAYVRAQKEARRRGLEGVAFEAPRTAEPLPQERRGDLSFLRLLTERMVARGIIVGGWRAQAAERRRREDKASVL